MIFNERLTVLKQALDKGEGQWLETFYEADGSTFQISGFCLVECLFRIYESLPETNPLHKSFPLDWIDRLNPDLRLHWETHGTLEGMTPTLTNIQFALVDAQGMRFDIMLTQVLEAIMHAFEHGRIEMDEDGVKWCLALAHAYALPMKAPSSVHRISPLGTIYA